MTAQPLTSSNGGVYLNLYTLLCGPPHFVQFPTGVGFILADSFPQVL